MKLVESVLKALVMGLVVWDAMFVTPAFAKDDGTDTSFTQEKYIQYFKVEADGTYVENVEDVARINEERAITALAQQTLSYNQTRQKIEIISAYTEKPDGRRVLVSPDKIKDQQEYQSVGAPMFQDQRVKVLIFPEVAVGDRIAYSYRITCTMPLYPGQFEDFTMASFGRTDDLHVTYDMPESMPLYADSRGYKHATPVLQGGRRIYRWDYIPRENHHIENQSVAYVDYGQRLYVSTFHDYSDMAKAYDARSVDKAIAGPKVTALAHELTKGLSDPRAKAHAIGDWVRKNVRYVAVYIGAGGVVPHSSETILENLYGDCKDHTVLVESMLNVVGIKSTPALINFGNSFRLPSTPMTFNHVINYIPELDLYMDTTARDVAIGYLPPGDLDKQVLLTHTEHLAHTPLEQENAQKTLTEIHVYSNEKADFTQVETFTGQIAETNWYILSNTSQTDLDQRVKLILSQRGQLGGSTLAFQILKEPAGALQITMKGHNDNFADMPGPLGVVLAGSISNDLVRAFAMPTAESDRTQDFVCMSHTYEDEARYVVANDISILAIPDPVSVHVDFIDYDSHYERNGQEVLVKRRLAFKHPGLVCTPKEYQVMSPAINKILRDLRAQFILQKKPA